MKFLRALWLFLAGKRCGSHGSYFSDFCPICTKLKFLDQPEEVL